MKKKQKNGFTLIELLVVLAIVGILIALAIIGLRAAQSSQRDIARKQLVSNINAKIQEWQGNTGSYPASLTASGFIGAACAVGNNAGGGILVNNTCLGLDGLLMATPANNINNNCGTAKASLAAFNTTDFYICYNNTSGTAGYTLGTYLEGSSTAYIVAN